MKILKKIEVRIRLTIAKYIKPNCNIIECGKPELVFKPIRSMLFLRYDRIGDLLISIPTIRALRAKFKDARIDILLGKHNVTSANIVDSYVDRIYVYKKQLLPDIMTLYTLRKKRYDILIDMMDHSSTTSALAVKFIPSRYSVGLCKERLNVYTHCVPLLHRKNHHIIERTANLLLPFGIDPNRISLDMEYPLNREEVMRAQSKLPPRTRKYLLVINISGRDDRMWWGTEKYIQLIQQIQHSQKDVEIFVGSSTAHADDANLIHSVTGATVIPVTNSFHEYVCLLCKADCIITPDTSIVHVAAALKIPTVVLFRQETIDSWYPYRSMYRSLVTPEETIANISVNECLGETLQILEYLRYPLSP